MEENYARMGAAVNANALISGTVMKLGSRTILTSSLMEVESGKILFTSRLQLRDLDEVFNEIPKLVKGILEKLPEPNVLVGIWDERYEDGCSIIFNRDGTFIQWNYIGNNDRYDDVPIIAYYGKYQILENNVLSMLFLDSKSQNTWKDYPNELGIFSNIPKLAGRTGYEFPFEYDEKYKILKIDKKNCFCVNYEPDYLEFVDFRKR